VAKIRYEVGDVVVVMNPGLDKGSHIIEAPDGSKESVNWNETKIEMVGKEFPIRQVLKNGMVEIYSNGVWLFHPDWLHFPGPTVCKCDWFSVLYPKGCQCGCIAREKKERERSS
jgi:hypothetical protein